jgi:hypothetical protein
MPMDVASVEFFSNPDAPDVPDAADKTTMDSWILRCKNMDGAMFFVTLTRWSEESLVAMGPVEAYARGQDEMLQSMKHLAATCEQTNSDKEPL